MTQSKAPLHVRCTAPFVIIAVTLFAGLTLRVWLALGFPTIYHPDEVFQMLEPAHRLATGWGIVTWEWRAGARSWLLPGIFAGLMTLVGAPDAEPQSYLVLITIVLSLASLSIVAIAGLAGRRLAGIEGLAIAGAFSAGWYDLVYFGSKPLTEPIAADVLVVAVYLATVISIDGTSKRRWLLILLGCLLGLTFWIRFHLAPALPIVAGWACQGRVRERWLPLLAGAAMPLTAFALTDWLTWGAPFQSVLSNFWINLIENRSVVYGTAPFYWYFSTSIRLWKWALLPIFTAASAGARSLPLFAIVSTVIVFSMSVVPHKELRFIFPAIVLIIVLAGAGTALIVKQASLLLSPASPTWLSSSLAIVFWLFVSATVATSRLHSLSSNIIQAETYLHDHRDMCGLGVLGIAWQDTSGYTRLNLSVPITQLTRVDFVAHASSVNWLLASRDLISTATMKALLDRDDVPKFKTLRCWGDACVMRREGTCTPMLGWDLNTQLIDRNE
jgi:hypothetical protein